MGCAGLITSAILVLLRRKFHPRRLLRGGKLTYVGIIFVSLAFFNSALFYAAENVLGGDEAVNSWKDSSLSNIRACSS